MNNDELEATVEAALEYAQQIRNRLGDIVEGMEHIVSNMELQTAELIHIDETIYRIGSGR